jgi:hypothetical protein
LFPHFTLFLPFGNHRIIPIYTPPRHKPSFFLCVTNIQNRVINSGFFWELNITRCRSKCCGKDFCGVFGCGYALLPFWKRLKQSHANIIAVCSDMSSAYTKAIQNHLPEAIMSMTGFMS